MSDALSKSLGGKLISNYCFVVTSQIHNCRSSVELEQVDKLFLEQCGSLDGRLTVEQFTVLVSRIGYNSEYSLQCYK